LILGTKLQRISNLLEQTINQLIDSTHTWADFMKTASRLYKYPFEEQILIYAQRPDATACASIQFWNKHMRRWVNRGAKGIALIDDSAGITTLRHVFDVSDTHSLEHIPFRLWEMKKAYQEQVAEELSHQFGDADETSIDFDNQLRDIIRNAIQDNMADYLTEILTDRDGSYLGDLDELNAGAVFKEALTDSVCYMVFSRLGLDNKALPEDLFKDIFNFNTFDTVMQLGGAASDISEMLLRQIERTVKGMERQGRDRLAKPGYLKDNISKDENERSGEHGDHIHAAGRLPDTRSDAGRTGDAAHGQVRDAEEVVSQEPPERDIRGDAAVGEAGQPLGGDRPDGAGAGESGYGANGAEAGRDAGAESRGPDEMDGAYEHDQAPGGGSGASGPNLQLALFPTTEEQIEAIKQAEAEKTSAFSISQADIDEVLIRGSGVADGKYRIYLYFLEPRSLQDKAAFLRQEYGIGGRSHAIKNADHSWENHDGKGIKLTRGSLISPETEILLTWSRVAKRVGELIDADRYLSGTEKAHLPVYQEEQQARESLREAAEKVTDTLHDAQYRYALGDTVYIGADEYTVIGYDDETVTLNDEKFPLLSKEMPRTEFDRRLSENPLNNGFIVREIAHEVAEEEEPAGEKDGIEIGTELTIDGRRFVIDSVDTKWDKVSLRDVTFADATGFPIFRSESLAFVQYALEHQEPDLSKEPLQPAGVGGETAQTYKDPVSKKPTTKLDYCITDDALGHGGAKTKYGYNVAAIRTLQAIEAENRMATAEEQGILSRYVGWGGISQAFDAENASWAKEYAELKQLLTDDEYNSARESTLNAHYTSPTVIKAIYQAIENMGFKTGNVLEPACGIGNFFGLVPGSMKDSKLYGVELDSITGRIAKQLYQSASIAVQGYEETNLPDSFFDLAIGNVPFGSYGIADKRYDKNHFLIHDYFFAKTLDKVRPGGIIAFITSKGTLDKRNPAVRKYIAQRADLIGAIRLPNNAFTANAGTQVTSDILFLQKRDRPVEIDPDWVHLSQTEDGIPINSYFAANSDMVLGTMAFDDMMYGNHSETTCMPFEGADLADQLRIAIENIHAELTDYERDELEENETESIPADPNVRNFSFALVDGQVYYRENSRMNKIEVSITATNRIRGMIELRDCTRRLIEYQLEGYPDEAIQREQQNLNVLYGSFTAQYGLINSRANDMAFSDDSSYCLLCSLEVIDENGEVERKADMFTKRTIKPHTVVTSVDTASEALAVSLAEKACVDLSYMANLAGLSEEQIEAELKGVIFRDLSNVEPENVPRAFFQAERFPLVTADDYLSGNVRQKLKQVRELVRILPADQAEKIRSNVTALEAVQPQDLTAGEIDVRLGATWLPSEDIQQFVVEFLKPSYYAENRIKVHYSPYTASWNVEGKKADYDGVLANVTYGTNRINAYQIIEQTLNLKDVRIFDKKIDADGKEVRVLNRKETTIAQQKQQQIKDAFREWIWKDHNRRERLVRLYNERFNSIRPRVYEGSHLKFSGINPEITLRPHQVNAIAHILYGGNTLLGHVVGAGKTFEMVAAAMESKRLGLCSKSLFVVPNHLTEQWAAEFLQLYPSANILVATRKDFEKRNRRKFCGRIATGDYDAVIIGHSQFEKIPMSIERQKATLQEQLDEIVFGIADAKAAKAERFTVKQLEKTKKAIKLKLDKLNDTSRKDDVVTFEELGVDRLFVDEAHNFKNLFLITKMRNVAGLAQTEAQKSSDLFIKCRYLDDLTGGRGVVFATGTPISNSMTELYTMQRYLQYEMLRSQGLQHFDAWASTFGETVTAIELAPEGTGYRAKTRFARFYNLPELISIFKMVADIQTADMLNLPVPEAEYHNVVIKPSEHQRNMVAQLAERAEKVRNGIVDATEDNMLKITNDGRKLALDQRLISELLPDDADSKVSACVDNIYRLWEQNRDKRLTQLVFCDLSTPHYDGSFNVYNDTKRKLIEMGVPEDDIAFIHDANTEIRKSELFANVRKGNVRILLGSTFKMGAGTNVQKRLVAEHHLDVPWRPSDIEQREGRIIRQGNDNEQVHVFRYVTENTFDSYMWQTIENKQKFISQIMTSKSPVRSCEDIDETALSYAEVKALATGNPYIKEKMDLDIQVARLKLLKASHLSQRYAMEDNLHKYFPSQIRQTEERICGYGQDIARLNEYALEDGQKFSPMTIGGIQYDEKELAGMALLEACKAKTLPEPAAIGEYRGFTLVLSFDTFSKAFQLTLKNVLSHSVTLGNDVYGNISRIDNALSGLPERLEQCKRNLEDLQRQVEEAKLEVEKPFAQEQELAEKAARLAELDALLNMEKGNPEMLDGEPEQGDEREIDYISR
jgi:N12 class adenine-specific DNA methylase/adenine-specific DNA methylase